MTFGPVSLLRSSLPPGRMEKLRGGLPTKEEIYLRGEHRRAQHPKSQRMAAAGQRASCVLEAVTSDPSSTTPLTPDPGPAQGAPPE